MRKCSEWFFEFCFSLKVNSKKILLELLSSLFSIRGSWIRRIGICNYPWAESWTIFFFFEVNFLILSESRWYEEISLIMNLLKSWERYFNYLTFLKSFDVKLCFYPLLFWFLLTFCWFTDDSFFDSLFEVEWCTH
jgi:hypothetical protein